MQPSHQMIISVWGLIVLGLLSILIFLFFRFGITVWRSPSKISLVKSGIHASYAVAESWLAPTVVAAIFVGLSATLGRETENRFLDAPVSVKNSRLLIDYTAPPLPPDAPPFPPDTVKEEPSADATRPAWLEEGDRTNSDVRVIVLSSKLWSTEAEANQELLPRAAQIVRDDFDVRHQSLFERTGHRLLSDKLLFQFAVKQRYLERIENDFGTFSSPMYRLWMQVEVSPEVRTAIYPAWKSAVRMNRVVAIGVALSLLTLAANALALFGKLKNVFHWSWIYSGTIAASSALLWALCGLFLVIGLYSTQLTIVKN